MRQNCVNALLLTCHRLGNTVMTSLPGKPRAGLPQMTHAGRQSLIGSAGRQYAVSPMLKIASTLVGRYIHWRHRGGSPQRTGQSYRTAGSLTWRHIEDLRKKPFAELSPTRCLSVMVADWRAIHVSSRRL